ncbi:protein MNN4-like [Cryptomeria japonica]|uniref:protein MNN4-like n=1 Tax=Cryptomeria japonica TaxID=3369 RepID=UPI0027DA2636|nr:protein MNN4-like [Cryptomeria japonica]
MKREKEKKRIPPMNLMFSTVDDIIGNVVSDIPNVKKDVEQSVENKSTVETIDIDVSSVKGTTQTKHPDEDEVIIEDISYEDKHHRTSVTINPIDNEPLLSEKGAEEENSQVTDSSMLSVDEVDKKEDVKKETKEKKVEKKGIEEETPKVINSSIPSIDEEEKKEIKDKKIERKETKTIDIGLEETKELEQDKKKEDSPSSQREGNKKTKIPPMKRKLDLEKESEKKKAKITISASSEVEVEEE